MTTAKLLAALAALATFVGCSGVDKCLEGVDPGCLGSAPDDSGNCKFGLVLSDDRSTCVDGKGNGNTRDAAVVDTSDSGGGGDDCSCPSGQLCRNDGTCVDLCKAVSNPPVEKPTPLPCRAPSGTPESFARIALALCYQSCIHRAVYCGTTCDPTSECTQVFASTAARAACQGMEDQTCAIGLCEKARDLPCAQQQCPVGTPNCSGTLCSNNCDQATYNNDGICDDGDPSNALSYVCDFGTDCGDCGPRRGNAPPFDLDFGDVCTDPAQCGGDLESVKTSDGWCVPATDNQAYSRCLPDCSNGKKCPAGYECSGIASDADGSGPMKPVQFMDENDGTLVFGCFPSQCGG
jgi:hypothetical protein